MFPNKFIQKERNEIRCSSFAWYSNNLKKQNYLFPCLITHVHTYIIFMKSIYLRINPYESYIKILAVQIHICIYTYIN